MGAVRGCFADFKLVKTRSTYQAIIEGPIEEADHTLAVLGGVPQPGKEQWVGIAPVTAPDKPADEPSGLDETGMSGHVNRKPKGGPRSKRAGILCGNPAFQNWIAWHEEYGGWLSLSPKHVHRPVTEEGAKLYIYQACSIESRAELDHNEAAGEIWDQIEADYRASQRGETDEALREQARLGP